MIKDYGRDFKKAIDPKELSLPLDVGKGYSPASYGYGRLHAQLQIKLEELIMKAEDPNQVKELAYDALQLLKALDKQQDATSEEIIEHTYKEK
jgi:hypothetical protein